MPQQTELLDSPAWYLDKFEPFENSAETVIEIRPRKKHTHGRAHDAYFLRKNLVCGRKGLFVTPVGTYPVKVELAQVRPCGAELVVTEKRLHLPDRIPESRI